MFRPYIKRTSILVTVAIINLLLVYISYISYDFTQDKNYKIKIDASKIMQEALIHTNEYFNNIIKDSISQKIDVFNRSKNDIESELLIFNSEPIRQKESALNIHQNDKSTSESKIKSLENELNDVIEHIPKYIKSVESTLNQISAVQYTIRAE